MDYKKMAEELLAIRAEQLKVPANQQMSKLVKGELFVLNYLSTHNEAAYPKELSREMVVSTARIAVILNNMEEKSWITRTVDAQDNRQTIVTLTDEGRREIEKKRREVIGSVAEMLEVIGPDDSQEFLRIQKKIASKCFRR
ncbi:MAG: transcriptional regulator [Lachnospiraceae bacterium]|nr:transcriptional regulator [Lachnospiraceae bacterium]